MVPASYPELLEGKNQSNPCCLHPTHSLLHSKASTVFLGNLPAINIQFIKDSQTGLGWMGPECTPNSTPCDGQTCSTRPGSSKPCPALALDTCRVPRVATASLGSPCQDLNTLREINFSLKSNLSLPYFSLRSFSHFNSSAKGKKMWFFNFKTFS